MAIARQAKLPCGLWVKMTVVTILGLCFIFVWTIFSSSSTSVTIQRESFEDIAEPVSSSSSSRNQAQKPKKNPKPEKQKASKEESHAVKDEKMVDGSSSSTHPHRYDKNSSGAPISRGGRWQSV